MLTPIQQEVVNRGTKNFVLLFEYMDDHDGEVALVQVEKELVQKYEGKFTVKVILGNIWIHTSIVEYLDLPLFKNTYQRRMEQPRLGKEELYFLLTEELMRRALEKDQTRRNIIGEIAALGQVR
jgi:hypothetical protein